MVCITYALLYPRALQKKPPPAVRDEEEHEKHQQEGWTKTRVVVAVQRARPVMMLLPAALEVKFLRVFFIFFPLRYTALARTILGSVSFIQPSSRLQCK